MHHRHPWASRRDERERERAHNRYIETLREEVWPSPVPFASARPAPTKLPRSSAVGATCGQASLSALLKGLTTVSEIFMPPRKQQSTRREGFRIDPCVFTIFAFVLPLTILLALKVAQFFGIDTRVVDLDALRR